jgi:RimJ/RimL family protein N-acetyltransferase
MRSLPVTVRTLRLTLRPLRSRDADVLHRIYQAEGVLRYFPNPLAPPIEKVERFITLQQAHWHKHGFGNWGLLPDGETEIIGWAGLQYLPELDETEVGFLLARPFWGRGYATEAAQAALQLGFTDLCLNYIIALVHPDNLASQRVIEKCGMAYQNTIRLWGIDLMRFRISRHESSAGIS